MTIKSINECLALFGFTLSVTNGNITLCHEGIQIIIGRELSKDKVEALLFNIPHWVGIIQESLKEEKGGESC